MLTGFVTLLGNGQEISVLLDRVQGTGGAEAPSLVIPISIEFKPMASGGMNSTERNYEVIHNKAELSATEKQINIGETTQFLSTRVFHQQSAYVNFSFPLSEAAVKKLEKYRKGNMPMKMNIQVQAGIFETLSVTNSANLPEERHFITRIETGHGDVSFLIEQSMWVKNILPQLGHNLYTLVELPAYNDVIPLEYAASLKEFDQARAYFNNSDYDKAVSHCRAALDPFKKPAQMENLKNFITSKSEFEWAIKVLDATDEWLEKVIKATYSFTSKPHHAPSVGHFARTDAEIVMMITTGIIAYIGKIGFKLA